MGEQLTLFIPNTFLHGQPPHTLDKCAFDLAFVNGGVNALTHVVHDIDGLEPPFACARVDFHFADRSAVAVVVKSTAIEFDEVVFDFRRHVKASDAQTDAV